MPTKRICREVFEAIATRTRWRSGAKFEKVCEAEDLLDPCYAVNSERCRSGDDALCDAVNDLLARKLNLGDAIERKCIAYVAQPAVIRTGASPKFVDSDSGEHLAMMNVLVRLTRGAELLEAIERTASYTSVGFVSVADFEQALADDRPVALPDGETYRYGGMCVCTASLLLSLRHRPAGSRALSA